MNVGTGNDRVSVETLQNVVGNECRSLSEADRREIADFLDPLADLESFFRPNERQREFLLDQAEGEALVLRIFPSGLLSRVRLTS